MYVCVCVRERERADLEAVRDEARDGDVAELDHHAALPRQDRHLPRHVRAWSVTCRVSSVTAATSVKQQRDYRRLACNVRACTAESVSRLAGVATHRQVTSTSRYCCDTRQDRHLLRQVRAWSVISGVSRQPRVSRQERQTTDGPASPLCQRCWRLASPRP